VKRWEPLVPWPMKPAVSKITARRAVDDSDSGSGTLPMRTSNTGCKPVPRGTTANPIGASVSPTHKTTGTPIVPAAFHPRTRTASEVSSSRSESADSPGRAPGAPGRPSPAWKAGSSSTASSTKPVLGVVKNGPGTLSRSVPRSRIEGSELAGELATGCAADQPGCCDTKPIETGVIATAVGGKDARLAGLRFVAGPTEVAVPVRGWP
jgi:hypothetical protein